MFLVGKPHVAGVRMSWLHKVSHSLLCLDLCRMLVSEQNDLFPPTLDDTENYGINMVQFLYFVFPHISGFLSHLLLPLKEKSSFR